MNRKPNFKNNTPLYPPLMRGELKEGIFNSRRGGFTLIEVLIASALLALILTALYSTFFLSHKAVTGLDGSMLKLQECRTALDILRRELESSFYRATDTKTEFKIEDRDEYGSQTSGIAFTTLSSLRNGVSKIKYYVKGSDDKLVLYKEVSSPYGLNEGLQEADIIEGIEEFILEARQGDKWVKTWDSVLMLRIPEEINITLKIKIKDKVLLLSERARPKIT
ncbi:MAG: prepilin-type N-terminal cleavage/methylation domain-containing protein [Nitrospirae bacterium]|nr:prepilin-type N-terminal cleavage/methylation domain-containing protein [Nitrospirota bacterium]